MSTGQAPPFQGLASLLERSEAPSPKDVAENAAKGLMTKALRAEPSGQTEQFAKELAARATPPKEGDTKPNRRKVTTERDSLYCLCGTLLTDPPAGGCPTRKKHPLAVDSSQTRPQMSEEDRRALVLAPLFSSKAAESVRRQMKDRKVDRE